MQKSFRIFSFFLFLAFLDQLSKYFAKSIAPSSLIAFTCNKNIAWSLPIEPAFFYPLWMVIFVFLAYSLASGKNSNQQLALVFILSGAVSNIFDRLQYGCVIDFIDLRIWPVFNLADIYITIGMVIILKRMLKKSVSRSETQ